MPRYEPWNAERASEIIARHRHLEGATLPILHALQEAFGCVPEAAVPMVAEALNLSRAEVHGTVTFYHDFREEPPGRRVLKLCRAESCQAAGGDALAARAEEKLGVEMGETTPDRRVTLEAGLLPRPLSLLAGRHARPDTCLRHARRGEARRAAQGGAGVSARIFISRDSGALCVGADEVARAFRKAAEKRGLDVEIVRTGSRGMYWLEPLVEVERPEGRVGYGPVKRGRCRRACSMPACSKAKSHPPLPRPGRGHPVASRARRG